jgi:hypothetical protein
MTEEDDKNKHKSMQELTYYVPTERKMLPVDVVDWVTLKSMIIRIKQPFKWYEFFAGGAVASTVAFLIEVIKFSMESSATFKAILVSWQLWGVLVSAILAWFLLKMSFQHEDHNVEKIQNIREFTNGIEIKSGLKADELPLLSDKEERP